METDTAPMTTNERPLINGKDVPIIRTTVDSIMGSLCATHVVIVGKEKLV